MTTMTREEAIAVLRDLRCELDDPCANDALTIALSALSGLKGRDDWELLRSLKDTREGWVLVPREPTTVMVNAGVDAYDLRTGFETVKHIYRAMVAIAPPAASKPTTVEDIPWPGE